MKKLSRLKLHQISLADLEAREMNTLKGGYCICDDGCSCSCKDNDHKDYSGAYNNNYTGSTAADQIYVGGPSLGY